LTDYGVEKYDIGTGFGHFGIAVEDVSLQGLPTFKLSYYLDWSVVKREL
jgi:hypothetical protein